MTKLKLPYLETKKKYFFPNLIGTKKCIVTSVLFKN